MARAYRYSPLRTLALAMLCVAGALLIVMTTVQDVEPYSTRSLSNPVDGAQASQGNSANPAV